MFAKFSPDGRSVAYVRENNLYVQHLAEMTVQQLTRDRLEEFYRTRFLTGPLIVAVAGDVRSAFVGPWHYIINGDGREELYNLDDDPGETNNLYLERPEIVSDLKARLEDFKSSGRSAPLR